MDVKLVDIISQTLGEDFRVNIDHDEFTLTFEQGSIDFSITHGLTRGAFKYSGEYHPLGHCEGNPCTYCGHTL